MTWKTLTEVETQRGCMTLVIRMCGDLPCVQLASYLEGSPLMWMMPLHLHADDDYDDNDDDDDDDDGFPTRSDTNPAVYNHR